MFKSPPCSSSVTSAAAVTVSAEPPRIDSAIDTVPQLPPLSIHCRCKSLATTRVPCKVPQHAIAAAAVSWRPA
ncbi:hypothetical protein E2C01_072989 [Portunus trituberculatus]|uniref:Uncharacterized protein n=1 Tax=Portunus trituberculatus TaxID=210409 RepID=A0A5B7I414_PORTR|nr:hypothetical protein [Portunus trituberculatus]